MRQKGKESNKGERHELRGIKAGSLTSRNTLLCELMLDCAWTVNTLLRSTTKTTPSRKLILAWSCTALGVLAIVNSAPALCLVPIAKTFGLDTAARGVFLSCTFWGLIVGMILAGPLADRLGFRPITAGSAVFLVAGLLVVRGADSRHVLYAGAVLAGIGCGTIDTIMTPLVCAVYPEARGRVSNILHAFYPAGIVAATITTPLLFSAGLGWRHIYVVVAAACVPHGVAFLLLRLPENAHEGHARLGARQLVRRLAFWALAGGIFFGAITEIGPSQWLPAYVEEASGGTRTTGSVALLVFAVLMFIGRIVASTITRHVSPRWVFIVAGSLCCASLAMTPVLEGPLAVILCFGVLGFGVGPFWPTILACAGDRFPQAGASMYAVLSAAGGLGCAVGPLVIGLVGSHHGLPAGMLALAAAPLLAVVLTARSR